MIHGSFAYLLGAGGAPNISVDLTPIIVALLAVVGALAAAGLITTKVQRRRDEARARSLDAQAGLSVAQTTMSHAQYEGFIAEAAERLSHISDAAIARLEAELARANQRIAELETELERVKHERDQNLAAAAIRERDLKAEMAELRDKVVDLERRLAAQGVASLRRHRDDPRPRKKDEDGPLRE